MQNKASILNDADQQAIATQPTVENVSENDVRPQELKPAVRRRKDKNRIHVTRHAVLSRHPLEALTRRGENVRQLRAIERMLRAELKPTGIVGELFFDRAYSSYLRCLLIARTEAQMFAPVNPQGNSTRTLRLQESDVPTLVWQEQAANPEHLSADLMKHLAIIQRYDNHFSREFYRAVAMLVAMRSGGEAGLARQLGKALGQGKEIWEDGNGE